MTLFCTAPHSSTNSFEMSCPYKLRCKPVVSPNCPNNQPNDYCFCIDWLNRCQNCCKYIRKKDKVKQVNFLLVCFYLGFEIVCMLMCFVVTSILHSLCYLFMSYSKYKWQVHSKLLTTFTFLQQLAQYN